MSSFKKEKKKERENQKKIPFQIILFLISVSITHFLNWDITDPISSAADLLHYLEQIF